MLFVMIFTYPLSCLTRRYVVVIFLSSHGRRRPSHSQAARRASAPLPRLSRNIGSQFKISKMRCRASAPDRRLARSTAGARAAAARHWFHDAMPWRVDLAVRVLLFSKIVVSAAAGALVIDSSFPSCTKIISVLDVHSAAAPSCLYFFHGTSAEHLKQSMCLCCWRWKGAHRVRSCTLSQNDPFLCECLCECRRVVSRHVVD